MARARRNRNPAMKNWGYRAQGKKTPGPRCRCRCSLSLKYIKFPRDLHGDGDLGYRHQRAAARRSHGRSPSPGVTGFLFKRFLRVTHALCVITLL